MSINKRKYISLDEVNTFLKYLKLKEKWDYYIIIHNIISRGRPFTELKKYEIIIPENIPIPHINPLHKNIRTVNKFLSKHGPLSGLREIDFSTKIFTKKFNLSGLIYYGILDRNHQTYKINNSEGVLYIVKHTHRNIEISKLLTDKKIGVSTNYTKRMESLTLGTIGIELIKFWKMPMDMARYLEKIVHEKLNNRGLIGEWFSDDDSKLVDIVTEIVSDYTIKESESRIF